ncbi:phosphotransferase family protein [Rhizobium skierniewicense]|uniref:phosphotransferase family protein n=1 Tax=Rhizobium skierniewicense TaxID=984260 RepID=UPI0015719FCE|nr:phosphotransferase family protein [Rhizobium skierniewicense]NTF35010.1 phosphotransferase family protein [Rhizobium skierniewicense]
MNLAVAHKTMQALDRPGESARASRLDGGRASQVYRVQNNNIDVITYVLPAGTMREAKRRFTVMARVADAFSLAPRPLAIGAPIKENDDVLLVVERLDGVPPSQCGRLDAPTLWRLTENFVSALAKLHAVKIDSAERIPDFLLRTLGEWERRWNPDEATDAHRDFIALLDWLKCNVPDQSLCALTHNDFKLDNILVDPGDPARVLAVVDWEMATIGHPMADLGIVLSYWIEEGDSLLLRREAPGPTCAPGAPTRRDLVNLYAVASGREVGNLPYWHTYGLLRLAIVTQNLSLRSGNDERNVPRSRLIVSTLLQQAMDVCERGRL